MAYDATTVPQGGRRPRRRAGSLWLLGGGLTVTIAMLSVAIFAPALTTSSPIAQNLLEGRLPPAWEAGGSATHLLGTDYLGRDVWSRIAYGARTTLLTATAAALGAAALGVLLGFIAGYYEGRIGAVIMALVDLMLAFPLIVLALALVATLGPSMQNVVLALIATGWMVYARLVRAVVLGLKEKPFVYAARALGASDAAIIARHLFPNALTVILVLLPIEIARMIITEASLSFLGLGVPPPTPSWGRMLAENRLYLTIDYWVAVFPGLAITIAVLGVTFLGDGLRDRLDPRLRHLL